MSIPKISVISPSYNQAKYLETTIKSVLDQAYPNLEYIVIDGGSTDGSADIIRRHSQHLAYWVSEKDSGQSNAINKGFARCTGDILCWLNSDDYFEPGTLAFVSDFFTARPDVDAICGAVKFVDPNGTLIRQSPGHYGGTKQLVDYWTAYDMHQPSIFWRRKVYEQLGGVDETLHLTMDYDYWLRMSQRFKIEEVDRVLSCTTLHPEQKTGGGYTEYRIAQLKTVCRYYASPFSMRDWDIRFMLYHHLLYELARKLTGRKTIYDK